MNENQNQKQIRTLWTPQIWSKRKNVEKRKKKEDDPPEDKEGSIISNIGTVYV